jgi:hypothetical protein
MATDKRTPAEGRSVIQSGYPGIHTVKAIAITSASFAKSIIPCLMSVHLLTVRAQIRSDAPRRHAKVSLRREPGAGLLKADGGGSDHGIRC